MEDKDTKSYKLVDVDPDLMEPETLTIPRDEEPASPTKPKVKDNRLLAIIMMNINSIALVTQTAGFKAIYLQGVRV